MRRRQASARGRDGVASRSMAERVVRPLVLFAVAVGLLAAAGVPGAAAQASEAPIAVEVGGDGDRQRGFLDSLGSEDTDASEREIEHALRSRPWLELVGRDAEVTIEVTRRSVGESSRSKPKDGKVSVSWRFVVRATIRTRGERDTLEATTTSSESLTESEAARNRRETYRDSTTFQHLGRELADKAEDWILSRIDLLRPERPDAGFRHDVKHKWLVKGDGLEVTEVLPGSPAALAGLAVGDRIRAIDGEKGTSEMDLRARTWWFEVPTRPVRLDVERDKGHRLIECEVLPPRRWAGRPPSSGAVPGRGVERQDAGGRDEDARERGQDTRVRPGMKADEVQRLLGRPLRSVAFESRTVWTYDGFRVVFVDGAVTDVE